MFDQKLDAIHCFGAVPCTPPDRTGAGGSRIIPPALTAAPPPAVTARVLQSSRGGRREVLQMLRRVVVCANTSRYGWRCPLLPCPTVPGAHFHCSPPLLLKKGRSQDTAERCASPDAWKAELQFWHLN